MRVGGETQRVRLADGCVTTVHTVFYPVRDTRMQVVRLTPEAPLEEWCERAEVSDAVSGGFSVKPEYKPLGELWVDGQPTSHQRPARWWSETATAQSPAATILRASPPPARSFDEDITADREPRLALALTSDSIVAFAADGRAAHDAGLTLWELAGMLVEIGAHSALNLDGGSAAVLVTGGRRINTPRTDEGEDMQSSSPSVSAIMLA